MYFSGTPLVLCSLADRQLTLFVFMQHLAPDRVKQAQSMVRRIVDSDSGDAVVVLSTYN
jgi:hypothetical protein